MEITRAFAAILAITLIPLAFEAAAQQPGEVVPQSQLQGQPYSLEGRGSDQPKRTEGRRPGDDVAQAYIAGLQRELPKHGYHTGRVTGRLDSRTEQAILAYQADAGLSQDAHDVLALKKTLDDATFSRPPVTAGHPRQAPASAPAEQPAPPPAETARPQAPPASTATAVAPAPAPAEAASATPVPAGPAPSEETVRMVQDALRARGYDIEATGKMDVYTVNAIKVFQAANGLPRDGNIDDRLLNLLKR